MQLEGKCAIVTGGADGFGKALVERLVENGAKVVFGDIAVSKGQELEKNINQGKEKKVFFLQCDVRKEDDLKQLFKTATDEFGGAQILINNAGVGIEEKLENSTDAVDLIVDINLKAVIKGTSLAIQYFNEQKKSSSAQDNDFSIVNISSASALLPMTKAPVYSVTKRGVMYFSQALRYLKRQGIRVNCVLPGFAKTNIVNDYIADPQTKKIIESSGGYLQISKVVDAIYDMVVNKERAGDAFLVTVAKSQLLPRISKADL